ncbi:MAG: hypothetical protein IT436_05260 [Phycisphaerales bacterium]|nr:hypothetical protein [Phycisphaerales bacterium]
MPTTLAQLPAFEPARGGVPRCGYRLWSLSIVNAPRRPGMAHCLARVDFDYYPGGAAGRCVNVRARCMADEEHGDYWISTEGVPLPAAVSESVCAEVLDSLLSAGFLSPPAYAPVAERDGAGALSVRGT